MKKPEFNRYVCDEDCISWTKNGFDIIARIERDDCNDASDERDCAFWPSLDPKDAGYIGPKSRATLERHMKRAKETMMAWKNDEWWYVGVCVTVSFDDVELVHKYDHAVWGIEANYPTNRKGNPNAYLTVVARELADDALDAAKAKLDKLQYAKPVTSVTN